MEITGVVQSIIFRNTDNGYTVLSLFDEEKNADFTACGALPLCSVGDTVRLEGSLKFHPRYGQQFAAAKCEVLAPSTLGAIESYLSSGTVKGIGPAMARILVNTFGMDTLRIMEEEPRRLLEIPGIGPKKYRMIADSFQENRTMREILLSLEPYGMTVNQAYKLYKKYGDMALMKVQENPYQLIDDIEGIGFVTADAIAQRVAGFETTSAARLFAGLRYALQDARSEYGHTYLPKDKLLLKTMGLLGVDPELLEEALEAMVADESLLSRRVGETEGIFLPYLARMEEGIAQKLTTLLEKPVQNPFWDVAQYQQELGGDPVRLPDAGSGSGPECRAAGDHRGSGHGQDHHYPLHHLRSQRNGHDLCPVRSHGPGGQAHERSHRRRSQHPAPAAGIQPRGGLCALQGRSSGL